MKEVAEVIRELVHCGGRGSRHYRLAGVQPTALVAPLELEDVTEIDCLCKA